MKRFSRLVAAMVALALVLTGVVFAEAQGTIAERYQDALSRLERYLMNLQDDSVNITTPPITKGPTPTITTTPTPPPQWSAWTQWSTTPVSSSATRQVETKVETETYSIPVYHYSRWHYYNTGYNKWYYSYAEYTGSNYKPGTGNWEYMSSYEPLSKNGTADGHQRYENYWWNETVSYEQDSYEVTYYRYRDLQ